MKALFNIPLLLIFCFAACKKPILPETSLNSVPPIVLSTSLKDSIPIKIVTALNLDDVTGTKIQYITGQHISYFEYDAEGKILLQALSQLPFSVHAAVADIVCHEVPFRDLDLVKQEISVTELENSSFFWTTDRDEFEVFECIKAPMRHTILISKNSKRILHRIEFLG